MAILNFQKPDKVIMIDSSEFEGKFEFRPLEPGYGLTVGNALRRVLLSSLEGFAITSCINGMGILPTKKKNRNCKGISHFYFFGFFDACDEVTDISCGNDFFGFLF